MCFSAVASFAGGAVISGVGVAAEKESKKPGQRFFASVPFIFALQQFAEGTVWLTLKSERFGGLQNVGAYTFLIAALIVWPFVVPLSMYLMEKEKDRKILLIGLLVMGSIVSIYNVYSLINYQVTPQIQNSHIIYVDNFPSSLGIVPVLYVISTVIPLFVSSVKRMWLFGGTIVISLVVTIIYFTEYLTSVWCFFAAILSVMIYWILKGSKITVVNTEPLVIQK